VTHTAADFLDLALHQDTALLDANARRQVEELGPRLVFHASAVGFEIRLGETASRVDLGVAIRRADATRPWTTARMNAHARSGWERLEALRAAWREPASALSREVPHIFLEFDSDDAGISEVPSVFLSFDPPLAGATGRDDARPVTPDRHGVAATREALGLLLGDQTPSVHDALLRCFAALPPNGYLLHAGCMLGREPATLRILVVLRPADVSGYLAAIGRSRCLPSIETTLHDLDRAGLVRGEVELQIDPLAADDSAVDVEVSGLDGDTGLADLAALLRHLVDRQVCSRQCREALLRWPETLLARSRQAACVCERRVSHVKLRIADGRVRSAKAYLSLSARPTLFAIDDARIAGRASARPSRQA